MTAARRAAVRRCSTDGGWQPPCGSRWIDLCGGGVTGGGRAPRSGPDACRSLLAPLVPARVRVLVGSPRHECPHAVEGVEPHQGHELDVVFSLAPEQVEGAEPGRRRSSMSGITSSRTMRWVCVGVVLRGPASPHTADDGRPGVMRCPCRDGDGRCRTAQHAVVIADGPGPSAMACLRPGGPGGSYCAGSSRAPGLRWCHPVAGASASASMGVQRPERG